MFRVLIGTDPNFPSVRIRIGGYRGEQDALVDRQIAVVFRRGETVPEMRESIRTAVTNYLILHPRVGDGRPVIPQAILNFTDDL